MIIIIIIISNNSSNNNFVLIVIVIVTLIITEYIPIARASGWSAVRCFGVPGLGLRIQNLCSLRKRQRLLNDECLEKHLMKFSGQEDKVVVDISMKTK